MYILRSKRSDSKDSSDKRELFQAGIGVPPSPLLRLVWSQILFLKNITAVDNDLAASQVAGLI